MRPNTSINYFTEGISCSDIRLSFGPHWIARGQVFIKASAAPLADNMIVNVAPGTLIAVKRPGLRSAAVFPLEEPAFWFRDVSDVEVSDAFEPYGSIGVLGSLADWLCIRTRLDMPAQQVR